MAHRHPSAIALLALPPLALVALTFSSPGNPEATKSYPVEAVVAACDQIAAQRPGGCSYNIVGNGLNVCTDGGTCYRCPADGSRQCNKTARRQGLNNGARRQPAPAMRR